MEAVVLAWCASVSASPVDAEATTYVAALLADGDVDADDLSEVLHGYVPGFADLSAKAQDESLTALLSSAFACQAAAAAASGPPTKLAPVVLPDAAGLPLVKARAGLDSLLELTAGSGLQRDFVAHVLARCEGDTAAAADFLLETTAPLLAAEAARFAADQDALRQTILGRYDLVENKTPGSSHGVIAPRGPELGQRGAAVTAKLPKTRYHANEVVTLTGAKYIVEKLTPEWDGGSRGKVKPKGKRGKAT